MRIVWTKFEKQLVSDSLVHAFTDHPNAGNKQAFAMAQQALPYERRGKVTDQRVFTYKAMINAARNEAEKIRADKAKVVAAKPPEPPAPEPRKLDTLGQVFELFVDALADRIIDKMIKAKEEHESQKQPAASLDNLFGGDPLEQLDKVFDSLYPEFKKAPFRRPTALVIGLNGHQMESIRQARPEVDFKFLSAEDAISHSVSTRDHTFLMTRFINHSVQNKYRKHPNLHFVNGGVTELKTLLHGIFNKVAA